MKKETKWIYGMAYLFIILFLSLAGYLIYFTTIEKKKISIHPYNKRLDHLEKEMIRGDIYDTNGILLATTEGQKRVYPLGSRYAHAVGYSQRGKYGAEALVNTELLYPDYTLKAIFENAFFEEKFMGRDVVLTLDNRLQKACERGLNDKKGGVIILEPNTGKIKAMYSNPSFDPNNLANEWEYLVQDEQNSALMNRAVKGLYPPGSIFKLLPATAYIQKHPEDYMDLSYLCEGKITKQDYTIKCFNHTVHGELNLSSAFAKSCNSFFVNLSDDVSPKELQDLGQKLLFNSKLPFDMDYSVSRLNLIDEPNDFNVKAAYIGQGKTLVSPLHMAMLASIVANDGVLMKPYLFDYSMSKKGSVRLKNLPSYVKAYLSEDITQILNELMIGVVEEGTATALQRKGMVIGGKTGTAENETGQDHSWFIGFAYPKDKPENKIAFAIIVENGGKGAKALGVADTILNVFSGLD